MKIKSALFVAFSLVASRASALNFEAEREHVLRQAGCYIVDYSFTEVAGLKPGYTVDERVYDTNSDKTTYELIVPIQKSPTEIRLQHVLFIRDLKSGRVGGLMKHHAEDWAFSPNFRWDFQAPGTWAPKAVPEDGRWVRKTTNLDDGLRYQCEGKWSKDLANPEFNCANFAPIPGRETRDMGRKDYNTLDRQSRVITYPASWVERQDNVKTIFANGEKTPLARELGRTWYVRQPDADCAYAAKWVEGQRAYWTALMEVWEEYLGNGEQGAWRELPAVNGMPRFAAMMEVEEDYAEALGKDPSLLPEVKAKIRAVIESYRAR